MIVSIEGFVRTETEGQDLPPWSMKYRAFKCFASARKKKKNGIRENVAIAREKYLAGLYVLLGPLSSIVRNREF